MFTVEGNLPLDYHAQCEESALEDLECAEHVAVEPSIRV